MNAAQLFLSSFAVGLSGAMSPGPLLVVVIAETVTAGMAAPLLLMAGHAVLELVMAGGLLFGLQRLRDQPGFESGLSVAGGLVMILLAADMLRNLGKTDLELPAAGSEPRRLAIAAAWRLFGLGIGVSILNPYWTIWWLTIGSGFMANAGVATIPKAAAFYTGHVLSDFAWYVLVGVLVVWGRRFLSRRVYRAALGLLAVILALFGVAFLWHGTRGL